MSRMHALPGGLAMLFVLAACATLSPPPPAAVAASTEAPVVEPVATPKPAPAAEPAPPVATPKPAAAPRAAPPRPAPAKEAPAKAPPAQAAPAPPPLDIKSLEQRLKDTEAIGLMTKLSIKNQVDDLVDRFRAYHDGHRPPTLAELRRPFEMLLMKLLALLQDRDPTLATALDRSREAIWGVLADRQKFSQRSS
jgi:hypothetical protein